MVFGAIWGFSTFGAAGAGFVTYHLVDQSFVKVYAPGGRVKINLPLTEIYGLCAKEPTTQPSPPNSPPATSMSV
jgi:hypothetical protein